MRLVRAASASILVVLAAACQATGTGPNGTPPAGAAVRSLGEPYRTTHGEVYLIRVQDEYRLIRCIPEGPIAGCYEDVFKIPRETITDDSTPQPGTVRWNQWVEVPGMPGVELMFLAPDRIALRELAPVSSR